MNDNENETNHEGGDIAAPTPTSSVDTAPAEAARVGIRYGLRPDDPIWEMFAAMLRAGSDVEAAGGKAAHAVDRAGVKAADQVGSTVEKAAASIRVGLSKAAVAKTDALSKKYAALVEKEVAKRVRVRTLAASGWLIGWIAAAALMMAALGGVATWGVLEAMHRISPVAIHCQQPTAAGGWRCNF